MRASEEKARGEEEWATAEGYKPWSLVDEEDKEDVFGLKEDIAREVGETGVESSTSTSSGADGAEKERIEEATRLQREEQELTAILKGTSLTLCQHSLRDNRFLLFVILKVCACVCVYFV